jgi:hypothetical protein
MAVAVASKQRVIVGKQGKGRVAFTKGKLQVSRSRGHGEAQRGRDHNIGGRLLAWSRARGGRWWWWWWRWWMSSQDLVPLTSSLHRASRGRENGPATNGSQGTRSWGWWWLTSQRCKPLQVLRGSSRSNRDLRAGASARVSASYSGGRRGRGHTNIGQEVGTRALGRLVSQAVLHLQGRDWEIRLGQVLSKGDGLALLLALARGMANHVPVVYHDPCSLGLFLFLSSHHFQFFNVRGRTDGAGGSREHRRRGHGGGGRGP